MAKDLVNMAQLFDLYGGVLTQKQRDLFVRRYWYATDIAALSGMFHMTESHVTVTLSRLRKRLQKHLRKEGLL